MMHIFDEIADKLPEFRDFLKYKFKDKKTEYIKKSNSKSVPYKILLKELFHPSDQNSKDCTTTLEEVAHIAIEVIRTELEDENKATYKYWSISGSSFLNTALMKRRRSCQEKWQQMISLKDHLLE